jgi:DNA-binding NtrC family response regulator
LPASPEIRLSDKKILGLDHKGKGTIIIMDDEQIIRDALKDMLVTLGYEVLCTENGRGAFEVFMAEMKGGRKITAIILDLTVPGGPGGKEIIPDMRRIDFKLPIFVASGYSDDPAISDPERFGFTASLRKPFIIAELSELLNKYLRANQSE